MGCGGSTSSTTSSRKHTSNGWSLEAPPRGGTKCLAEQQYDLSTVQPGVSYQNVRCEDKHRHGRPYRVLHLMGESIIHVSFDALDTSKVKGLWLELNHCRTLENGSIDIWVNWKTLVSKYDEAPDQEFGTSRLWIDKDRLEEGSNSIHILLNYDSPGAYWISDITIEFHAG